jgi:GTPase SAR1 family protein
MSNTLGACFHRYECDSTMIMDLWDTAGQEKFRSLLTMYYKNSDAVVIVFDLTDEHSFRTVEYWTKQIEANCDSLPCTILPIQVSYWWVTN